VSGPDEWSQKAELLLDLATHTDERAVRPVPGMWRDSLLKLIANAMRVTDQDAYARGVRGLDEALSQLGETQTAVREQRHRAERADGERDHQRERAEALWQMLSGRVEAVEKAMQERDHLRVVLVRLVAALPKCGWKDGCTHAATRRISGHLACDAHALGSGAELGYARDLRAALNATMTRPRRPAGTP